MLQGGPANASLNQTLDKKQSSTHATVPQGHPASRLLPLLLFRKRSGFFSAVTPLGHCQIFPVRAGAHRRPGPPVSSQETSNSLLAARTMPQQFLKTVPESDAPQEKGRSQSIFTGQAFHMLLAPTDIRVLPLHPVPPLRTHSTHRARRKERTALAG